MYSARQSEREREREAIGMYVLYEAERERCWRYNVVRHQISAADWGEVKVYVCIYVVGIAHVCCAT